MQSPYRRYGQRGQALIVKAFEINNGIKMALAETTSIRAKTDNHRLIRLLRVYRLRWLKWQIGESLERHKQAVVLFVCLGAGAGATLLSSFRSLAWPVVALGLMRPSQPLVDLALLALVDALALLWVGCYRSAIAGGAFSAYLRTLPISDSAINRLNIWTAAASDVLFWIVFAIAVVVAPYRHLDAWHTVLFIWHLALLAGLIVAVQVRFLQDWREALTVVVVETGLLWLSGRLNPNLNAVMLLLATGGLAWAVTGTGELAKFHRRRFTSARAMAANPRATIRSFPRAALRLYWALLWRDRWMGSLARLGDTLMLFAFAIALVALGAWYNHALDFLTACLGLGTLILSGFIRSMRELRLSMAPLLATLPVSKLRWASIEIGIVLIMVLAISSLPIAAFIAQGRISLMAGLDMWLWLMPLTIALYWAQQFARSSSLAWTVSIAGLWITGLILWW
jgi:hypothetical protein